MTYDTFPTSVAAPSFNGLDEEDVLPQIATPFDDGSVKTADKYTRARLAWSLQWDVMPEDQFQTLRTFWRANRSKRFYWIHPLTGVQYLCVFGSTNLKSNPPSFGVRKVTLNMQEV